ncbi:MAG TPA: hypothetical protein VFD84_20700, partial [Candidatus Binatia bacterium]|nr:hypothetical protein [Candidatus Binatia bacterium]
AFWGLAARPTARATVVGAALVALVALPEVLVPRASRMRIGLHSPASVELGDLRGQADVAAERLAADEGRITFLPNWSPAGPPFVRVTGPEAHLTLADAPRRRGVLRVVARPLRGVRRRGCARLEVSVDGVRVAAPALHVDWRTYPFALPALAPGPHRVALRVLTGEQPPAPHDPVLGIALVAFGR